MFNTNYFIFIFLPLSVLGVLVVPQRWRKAWLLTTSLVFYTLATPLALPLVLIFTLLNFRLAGRIQEASADPPKAKRILTTGLVVNLGVLILLKVGTVYFLPLAILHAGGAQSIGLGASLQAVFRQFITGETVPLAMPLGLSYLVFQSTAYLVDVYKQRIQDEKDAWSFLAYLVMFPKVIAGPIVRFQEVSRQLSVMTFSRSTTAGGLRRFAVGMGKKVLVADTLGMTVDHLFSVPQASLTCELAWTGVIAYTLQLYFDFSGYSDMAIGLGMVFGFQFPENFNYPYLSRSLTDFWRRWHMTLLNWFRIYVFFPLERNRKGAGSPVQTLNILVVFLLTGLWHGITLNYIAWGLLQGAVLALERTRFGTWLSTRTPRLFQHAYTLLLILSGWVVFRSQNLSHAGSVFKAMAGFMPGSAEFPFSIMPPIPNQFWLALAAGLLFTFPLLPWLQVYQQKLNIAPAVQAVVQSLKDTLVLIVFVLSAVVVFTSASQANIYGGF